MNLDLLRDWLTLDPGEWPPDHYALLGLPVGEGDSGSIEDRALERMELLRTHQIRHQEEVTEGMNRLAQAMVCLSDPAARRDYDSALGIRVEEPTTQPSPPPEPDADEEEPLVLDLLEDQPEFYSFDDEPILRDLAEPTEEGAATVEKLILTQEDLGPSSPPTEIAYSAEGERREYRREWYAELARVRRLARAWDRLGPFLTDPEAPVSRRSDSQAFSAGLAHLRDLLTETVTTIGEPNQPGHRVALLAKHQLALQTFRGLVWSQRVALSEDWELARLHLRKRHKLLRAEVRASLRKGWRRRVLVPLIRRIAGAPEWALLPAALVTLAIAAWRSTEWGR